MTNVDKEYLNLLKDILKNGVEKNTRSGKTKSIFGRQLRFDLKYGLPILTIKKVFTKGIIHELLWFLKGETNILYLVKNNVHIWDDDAYRWYKSLFEEDKCVPKEEFLEKVLKEEVAWYKSKEDGTYKYYKFGDLGDVYGKQWRNYGNSGFDQIKNIIDTLRTNPDDRRMLCVAYNPDVLKTVALPPCHVMFQFYTRELTKHERWELYRNKFQNGTEHNGEKLELWSKTQTDVYDGRYDDELETENIPKRAISCMWTQRSADYVLGIPYNLTSYSILTYIIADMVNMMPDELIGSIGDCHIYLNQMDAVDELLKRNGKETLPTFKILNKHDITNEFTIDDFVIENYESDDVVKAPLSVG